MLLVGGCAEALYVLGAGSSPGARQSAEEVGALTRERLDESEGGIHFQLAEHHRRLAQFLRRALDPR